jgi:hypothetical protein
MTLETFLWGDNQGYEYRTFDRTHLDFNFVQVVRDTMTLASLFLVILSWIRVGTDVVIYLTFWGVHLTWFSLHLNRQAALDQKANPGKTSGFMFTRWRTAVILFQVTMALELVIPPLYFATLWETPVGRPWNLDDYLGVINHSVPTIFLLIDFFLQKWIWRQTHVWVAVLAMLAYGLVNFGHTVILGYPPYEFLTWDDTLSYITILAALVATYVFHQVFYFISRLNIVAKLYMPIYDPSIMYVMA